MNAEGPIYFGLDTGYTKICPTCNERWDDNRKLRGKSRTIDVKMCALCIRTREEASQRRLEAKIKLFRH